MSRNLMDYMDEFIEAGRIRDMSDSTGNYKAGNKAFKDMEKILKLAVKSDKKEEFYVHIFNSSDSPSAILAACVHMLKLGIEPGLARSRLELIASSPEKSNSRFRAKMILQEWDNGNIKRVSSEEKEASNNIVWSDSADNISKSERKFLEMLLDVKDSALKETAEKYDLGDEMLEIIESSLSLQLFSFVAMLDGVTSASGFYDFSVIDVNNGEDIVKTSDGGIHERLYEVEDDRYK